MVKFVNVMTTRDSTMAVRISNEITLSLMFMKHMIKISQRTHNPIKLLALWLYVKHTLVCRGDGETKTHLRTYTQVEKMWIIPIPLYWII